MKLYFKDTDLSYSQINSLLNSHIGPEGPNTWQNSAEKHPESGYVGYVEIYDHPAASFVKLKW